MNTSLPNKAEVLAEALPYIKRFSGKTVVIKYGGNVISSSQLQNSFARDVILLKLVGMHPVIVHGGGPQINTLLTKLGKEGTFIQGMRVTDHETMEVVSMVLGGLVNKEIVNLINHNGGKAVGITGQDSNFMQAKKLLIPHKDTPGELLDIGLVGEIEHIDPSLVQYLVKDGFIPVIAPIAVGSDQEIYNVNADVVAGKLAQTLQAEKLVMLTNTIGVLDKNGQLLPTINAQEIDTMIEDGTLSDGMLPKIGSALEAAHHGVKSVHIIDGRVEHALLLEILTSEGVGTLIQGF